MQAILKSSAFLGNIIGSSPKTDLIIIGGSSNGWMPTWANLFSQQKRIRLRVLGNAPPAASSIKPYADTNGLAALCGDGSECAGGVINPLLVGAPCPLEPRTSLPV